MKNGALPENGREGDNARCYREMKDLLIEHLPLQPAYSLVSDTLGR